MTLSKAFIYHYKFSAWSDRLLRVKVLAGHEGVTVNEKACTCWDSSCNKTINLIVNRTLELQQNNQLNGEYRNQIISPLCRAGAISGSGTSAFSRGGPGRGSKRKRGEKDPDTLMPVPFVKHHHSVKKFQVGDKQARDSVAKIS